MEPSLEEGIIPPEGEVDALREAGYTNCPKGNCNYWINPQVQSAVLHHGGYLSCPKCHETHDLMEDVPWHGAPLDSGDFSFGEGGGTRIGLSMSDQGRIGEDLIRDQGDIPGYGPIVWWHEGAGDQSPLDGATRDWGIEVKTIGYDAIHHRFIPGRTSEKNDKNNQAKDMGLRGILGILVVLNYRTSLADVYVKEMPLTPWVNSTGRTIEGVAAFRKHNGLHLLEEIPFRNPFADPNHPSPEVENVSQEEPVPF